MKFFIVLACALAAASAGYIAPATYGQHIPVIGPNGVPVDTPAVQQATASHLALRAEEYARSGHYAYAYPAPFAYNYNHAAAPYVAAPVHAGVAETPEVIAAKQAHFAAHAEARARVAPVHHLSRRGIYAAAPVVAAYAAPVAYASQHLPVIGANGVPVDTAEVQHARAAHYVHKAEAHARNGDYHAYPVASAAYSYGAYPYAYGAYPYSYGAYAKYF